MRCKRTYLGHLTKRVKSRFGWMSPPNLKLRGVFSKSGFFWVFFFLSANGAEGSFFLPAAAFAALPILPSDEGCGVYLSRILNELTT